MLFIFSIKHLVIPANYTQIRPTLLRASLRVPMKFQNLLHNTFLYVCIFSIPIYFTNSPLLRRIIYDLSAENYSTIHTQRAPLSRYNFRPLPPLHPASFGDTIRTYVRTYSFFFREQRLRGTLGPLPLRRYEAKFFSNETTLAASIWFGSVRCVTLRCGAVRADHEAWERKRAGCAHGGFTGLEKRRTRFPHTTTTLRARL